MDIRPYFELPEDPDALPLVTEHATVTSVEPLDVNRKREVKRAVASLLEQGGRSDLVTGVDGGVDVNWAGLRQLVERASSESDSREAAGGPPIDALRALQDRFDRTYPSLLRIGLELEESLEFVPGQFVGINFQDVPRTYSISNLPGEAELELCVRRVPGGKLTWELFTDLEPGDDVIVRGPYGDFVLVEPSERDVVFLATGTGVAPFKSMIDFILQTNQDVHEGVTRQVWLFHGAGWEDDLPYREHFRELDAERANFHFVPTLSRERYLTDWPGETAYVQDLFVGYLEDAARPDRVEGKEPAEPRADVEERIDPATTDVYTCGINAMVAAVLERLQELSVPEEHVRAEGFG